MKRHEERRAEQHLSLRGIAVLLPRIEVVRSYPTQRVRLLEPLFPGYLFAQMEPVERGPERWYTLRWAPGVRTILGADGVPVPVPEDVIDTLRERIRKLGYVRPEVRFVPGSRVRIRRGPFAGFEAVFDHPLSRAERVRVLLQLLGDRRAVELDVFDLEPS